jgi:hypothetical protein
METLGTTPEVCLFNELSRMKPQTPSVFQEASGQDWFMRLMKRYTAKKTLRKSTGTAIARATVFRRIVGTLSDTHEQELSGLGCPSSLIFTADTSKPG